MYVDYIDCNIDLCIQTLVLNALLDYIEDKTQTKYLANSIKKVFLLFKIENLTLKKVWS